MSKLTRLFLGLALTAAYLVLAAQAARSQENNQAYYAVNWQPVEKGFTDSVSVAKVAIQKLDDEKIKIFPNPSSTGTIHVQSVKGQELQFYVFELDGTMVSNINLKGDEKKTIKDLKKGTYVYDVFIDDVGVERLSNN